MTDAFPGSCDQADNVVRLRAVVDDDLSVFFAQEQEPDGVWMAAFTAKDPSDRVAFDAHWAKIRATPGIALRTIVVEGAVVGHIVAWGPDDEREISYWLGRDFWGRGLATAALRMFLADVERGPVIARSAADNAASLRVLAKCGFEVTGEDRGFANARGEQIPEFILARP